MKSSKTSRISDVLLYYIIYQQTRERTILIWPLTRYTVKDNLLAKITEVVDSSYSISVSLTVEDLKRSGYEYELPNPGDSILAVDEALNFSQKIRIVSVEIDYDINGNRLQSEVTCGSLSAVDQKNQADAQSDSVIDGLINGNSTIPVDWLNDAIVIATDALRNTQTQLEFTTNGILAIDKNDANNVVIFNSAGIGVSTDGGKTFANAMTGAGINATAITAGVLKAIAIQGVTITGSEIVSQNTTNSASIDLSGGKMTFTNKDGNEVGFFIPTANASTGVANGLAIEQIPGFIFSINSKSATADTSTAILQIPATSTGDNPQANFYGTENFNGNSYFNNVKGLNSVLWISAATEVIISGNGGSSNALNVYGSKVDVLGDFTVYNGSKNAAQVTRDGVRLTPAYETAESYLGDIGSAQTDENNQVIIALETLFSDTVNTTEYEYQVFLQSYGDGYVYVSERTSTEFTVKSSIPALKFGWEVKAKRRGYEKTRLELSDMTLEELQTTEETMKEVKDGEQNIQS